MMKKRLPLFLISAILFTLACKKDKAISPESCGAVTYSFQHDIFPIIQANCAINSCHGTNNNAPFTLLNYGQVDTAIRFHHLLTAIRHEGSLPMPRIDPFQPTANKLPDTSLRKIECWINQGGENN